MGLTLPLYLYIYCMGKLEKDRQYYILCILKKKAFNKGSNGKKKLKKHKNTWYDANYPIALKLMMSLLNK